MRTVINFIVLSILEIGGVFYAYYLLCVVFVKLSINTASPIPFWLGGILSIMMLLLLISIVGVLSYVVSPVIKFNWERLQKMFTIKK